MKTLLSIAIAYSALSLAEIACSAEANKQWPQFLGPGGNATTTQKNVPLRFGPQENLYWQVPIFPGNSSPCIWGELIFLSGYDDKDLVMFALDRHEGKILWERRVQATSGVDFNHRSATPAQPTACSDGERVYFYFGTYGLIALDFDGKTTWEKRLPPTKGNFGAGSSPILNDGILYLNLDNTEAASILAINAFNGETKWEHPRIGYRSAHSTPYFWKNRIRNELVIAGSHSLVSLDPNSGQLLWKVEDTCGMPCSSPSGNADQIVFGSWSPGHVGGKDKVIAHFDDELAFTDEELSDPSALFARFDNNGDQRIERDEFPPSRARDVFKWMDRDRNDGVDVDELSILLRPAGRGRNIMVAVNAGGSGLLNGTEYLAWEYGKRLPYVPTPLISENRVFFVKSLGLLTCLDIETGEPFYEGERLGVKGEYYTSPVKVGDAILVASSLGSVIAIRDSEQFEIVAQNDLGEEILATPAIVDDTLYLRTASTMWAFKEQ